MKAAADSIKTHNPFGEVRRASCLREDFTSSSYGEGLETGRNQAPRQSLTRQIFFKILKQNLRVKTFFGTSANALKIQIWTALIAILLLKYLKVRSRYSWSLSNLVALLRLNLFSYRDLWEWIDNPTEPPPAVQEQEQMALSFA